MEARAISILTGGPSAERGISLNSARSVCDHLGADDTAVRSIIYFSPAEEPYTISIGDLYSNTPQDFDYKLSRRAPLSHAELGTQLVDTLAFPLIHGPFGEDGALQTILEELRVPHVGTQANNCETAFDKFEAAQFLKSHAVPVIPTLCFDSPPPAASSLLDQLIAQLPHAAEYVLKPARGGSSLGVRIISSNGEGLEEVHAAFAQHERLVAQPRCNGIEFTVTVLQSPEGSPVALLPTEIVKASNGVFSYRHKYLPTGEVTYRTPPHFGHHAIQYIRDEACRIFSLLTLRDFARIDGWILDTGEIVFSDVNVTCGLEQNSFLFIQAAQAGLTHRQALGYILRSASIRNGITLAGSQPPETPSRKRVAVLFGGDTSERQVSLMSGTNVWLKLQNSQHYSPTPFLLTSTREVWQIPYSAALYHTVEEVEAACVVLSSSAGQATFSYWLAQVREQLGLSMSNLDGELWPRRMDLESFIESERTVFIALHGGIGEDGTLQELLEARGTHFNGSSSSASRLCIDKYAASQFVASRAIPGLVPLGQRLVPNDKLLTLATPDGWSWLCDSLSCDRVIVKPPSDGCSTGVAQLANSLDFASYISYWLSDASVVPSGSLSTTSKPVVLPPVRPSSLLFEEFRRTDEVEVTELGKLLWRPGSQWIEVTVGVLGRLGTMRAFTPSLTVAAQRVLSLEEKFMGGTGVNLTPPPGPPEGRASPHSTFKCKTVIERIANELALSGYARIDAFLNIVTGEVSLIEVNTLPGLTPSTVLFQQAAGELTPMSPSELLEAILEFSGTPISQH